MKNSKNHGHAMLLSRLVLVLFITLPSNWALAATSLEDQKSRLLERIIDTDDAQLRARLVSIYESLGDSRESKQENKQEVSNELYCVLRPKVIETKIVTPSNDYERGKARVTGETAKVVSNDRTWPAYLTPSKSLEGCKAKFNGKTAKLLDCKISPKQYSFQTRSGFLKNHIRVDRRTGNYSSRNSKGVCRPVTNDVLM